MHLTPPLFPVIQVFLPVIDDRWQFSPSMDTMKTTKESGESSDVRAQMARIKEEKMSILTPATSLPLIVPLKSETPESCEKQTATPILEQDRYLQRPDFEKWSVNGKEFKGTNNLLAAIADMKESQPATYKFRCGTLKDGLLGLAAFTGISAAGCALMGLFGAAALSLIGGVGNAVLWPVVFSTDFPLIGGAICGALAGGAGAFVLGAAAVAFPYVLPTKVRGTLTKEMTPYGEKLLFKPHCAQEKAIDLKEYDGIASTQAGAEKGSKSAWWDEAAQVQSDRKAGYAAEMSY